MVLASFTQNIPVPAPDESSTKTNNGHDLMRLMPLHDKSSSRPGRYILGDYYYSLPHYPSVMRSNGKGGSFFLTNLLHSMGTSKASMLAMQVSLWARAGHSMPLLLATRLISPRIFSILFHLWCLFRFTFIQFVFKWSLQNFAHASTAQLSGHVQEFVAIGRPWMDLQQIKFGLWWKNS